jgi:hypothetical protein
MEWVAHPDRLQEYRDIVIKVHEWGNFEHSDIGRNNMVRICDRQEVVDTQDEVAWMTVPPFVTNIEQKL